MQGVCGKEHAQFRRLPKDAGGSEQQNDDRDLERSKADLLAKAVLDIVGL